MNELMDMLAKRNIDFVLAFKPIQPLLDVESHILFQNSLSAIVRNNHPLASKEKVSIAELEKYELVLPSKGLQARNALAGVQAVNGYLDGSMENTDNDESEDDSLGFIIIFFVIFGGFIGLGLYVSWRKTRCPNCKKHKLQRLSSRVIDRSNGTKTEEVVYQCRNCGHILRRKEQSRDENYKGPRGGGPFIGGMGGGFFGGHGGSGGGFSGGSFGGGSFGGGGAGSRF